MKSYTILSKIWIWCSLISIFVYYYLLLFYDNDSIVYMLILPLLILNIFYIIPRLEKVERETVPELKKVLE